MQVEEVLLPRTSELTDPAVANVDFALLCFALANPPVSCCSRPHALLPPNVICITPFSTPQIK
jgi:hypothetical protein